MSHPGSAAKAMPPALYTPEQRARRDATAWTLVQGVLAPIQFLVFLVSLVLVLRCMATGEGEQWALWSVVIKTLTLYTIMVTGCIWEKVVFGQYLFAPAFLWEDIFSMLVLALHTLYLSLVEPKHEPATATERGLAGLLHLLHQRRAVHLEAARCTLATSA